MQTKLPIPAILTRTITDRVVFRFSGDGLLLLQDANRTNEIARLQLKVGDPAMEVVYETYSTSHGGAIAIQPDDWEFVCRAEASLTIGSVNFPFLRGANNYDLYPQAQRVRKIAVRFAKDAAMARITAEVVETINGTDYRTQQICELSPKEAFTAVFAGISENIGNPKRDVNGVMSAEVVTTPAGGVLTLSAPMSGGFQGPIKLGTP